MRWFPLGGHPYTIITLFALSLWFVKIGFMSSYLLIFLTLPMFKRLRWRVKVIRWVSFGFSCHGLLWDVSGNRIGSTRVSEVAQNVVHMYKADAQSRSMLCGVHMGSDLIGTRHPRRGMSSADENTVTIVPPLIVQRVQMRPAKKLALGALLSVVPITLARNILRSIESFGDGAFADSSLYTFVEVTSAVIVPCRPIHRGLPRGQTKKSVQTHTPRAFAPVDIGDAERQGLRSTSVTVCCSDRRPQGYLRTYLAPIHRHGAQPSKDKTLDEDYIILLPLSCKACCRDVFWKCRLEQRP